MKPMFLSLALFLVLASTTFAQDTDIDDDAAVSFADSSVTLTEPPYFCANTEYTFKIQVFNAAAIPEPGEIGIGIKQIDYILPSADWTYHEDGQPLPPAPLHPEKVEKWALSFDPAMQTITWQTISLVSTGEYGDIREQDVLGFSFIATTDGGPTDGFAWTLFGDDAAGSTVSGTWFWSDSDGKDCDDSEAPDDDADDDDQADDESDLDDDENSTDAGCGC